MSDIDAIRKKRMAEMMARAQQANAGADEEAGFAEQVAQLEAAVKTRMTKEAVSRYGNIKMVDPEKATRALAVMAQLIQRGRTQTIDEALLKDILGKLTPQKRDVTIRRA